MGKLPVFAVDRLRMATDGQGVTTLVATLGCPLSCRMCINPQSHAPGTRVRLYDTAELIDGLSVDGLYFAATGGGPTFGGGEPLLHAAFLQAFAERKPEDWAMNVETSLNVPERAVERLLEHVSAWIVDIKDLDPDIYRRYTGRDPAQVRRNLALLARTVPSRVLVRVPEIPGFNDAAACDREADRLRGMGFERIDRFRYVDPDRLRR